MAGAAPRAVAGAVARAAALAARARLRTPAAGPRRPPSTVQMGIYDKSVPISTTGDVSVHYVIETVY